jgi:Fuc2NAc and GlcNAc transferase
MTVFIGIVVLATLSCSLLLTRWMRRVAPARGLLDVPNARSSHQIPTPRGGGVAIVAASILGFGLLAAAHVLETRLLIALVGGGGAVALVGFIDDHRPLPPGLRLLMHIAAGAWALLWLGGLPPLRLGQHAVDLGVAGYVLGVLGIVWTLNLFNFMDGIDGIAASEAVFIGIGAALVAVASGGASAVALSLDLVFAAACCGFLFFNWPPARIFMGDVGSGFIGFVIAALAVAAARQDSAAPWQWLLLGAVFFVDATVTLLRRVARGERAQEAHRSHAYQWLARRWNSHRRVTVTTIAVNVGWLLPCAFLVRLYPEYALWILAGALAPLVIGALYAGAGRSEHSSRPPAQSSP